MHPLSLFLFAACSSSVWLMEHKALDDFVNLHDPHYQYTFLKKEGTRTHSGAPFFHTINMTSQKWLDESEVDKPVWSHKLTIVLPKEGEINELCLLIIMSDQEVTHSSRAQRTRQYQGYLSVEIKSVVAVLEQVPAQPLTFYKHPLGRKNIKERDIWAYSWWRFLNDPDAPPHWLVQFPMVKATVRAMDTVTDFMMKTYQKNTTQFVLTGVSMSSWAAWLTAAVDSRVAGIIPVGMNFLNFTENLHHQFRAYCGWSYMLRPLHEMNITQELDNPRFRLLASHVDPMAYNERYANIVKYIVIASGDQFLQPDSPHYYFAQLEGEKHLRIIPNDDSRFNSLLNFDPRMVFFISIFSISQRPSISWQRTMTNTTGIIHFTSDIKPGDIYSYHADTVDGTRRDFRMKITTGNSSQDDPVKWIRTGVKHMGKGVYKKEMKIPAEGWRAFFIQAMYQSTGTTNWDVLTSEIHIIPDTFPCPDCNGDGCHGTLV
ncbi:autocrine proliferation repressor protein A-like [Eublepharis macularius]|uniref:Autocrine proliferation repressor protein A-like n=1 Tax=Eublepharis macularius TaxID=481883 RepID=A0AA97J360_EUBMA|nr:autocrine proliferation repressor protein A-like [Eublepharis macularius]